MRILSVESWSFSGFAPSLPLVHDPRSAPIVPLLNRSCHFLSPFCPWIIFTGEDGGATNKEPSQQASPSMAAAATAAATTTVLALVAGLIAALRMKYMSADRRSGSSKGVANTTKADKNGTIKTSFESVKNAPENRKIKISKKKKKAAGGSSKAAPPSSTSFHSATEMSEEDDTSAAAVSNDEV